jgi:hypothetical protein
VVKVPDVGRVTLVAPVEVSVVAKAPEVANVAAANDNVAAEFVTVTLLIDVAVAAPKVGVVNVGAVNVLFVRVSVPVNVANVPAVGKVTLVAPVEVKVVAKAPEVANVEAARDKVAAEFVTVTLFNDVAVAIPNVGVVKVGAVNVLLVRVSTPARVVKVPDVGRVTLVAPVEVSVVAKAPEVANVAAAKDNVAAEFVTVTLLIDVAVAAPKVGVVNVGAVNVLFVKVSTPARVVKVPAVGRVTLVAPVEVSVVANVPVWARVPAVENVVPEPNDKVAAALVTVRLLIDVAVAAPKVGVVKVGAVKVLFVKVSTPARVAKVPAVGRVTDVAPVDAKVVANAPVCAKVPALENVVPEPNDNVAAEFVTVRLFKDVAVATPNVGVVKVGAVKVLFVKVSTPANVANVPAVGRVTVVVPVATNVCAKAPVCATEPAVESVVPLAKVNVEILVGAVITRLLMRPKKEASEPKKRRPVAEIS